MVLYYLYKFIKLVVVGTETLFVEVVSSEDPVDENSVVAHEELLPEEVPEALPEVIVKKRNYKEVSERPKTGKITHDHVLEEQYKALILKQTNLKLENKKLELEISLLEKKAAKEKVLQ